MLSFSETCSQFEYSWALIRYMFSVKYLRMNFYTFHNTWKGLFMNFFCRDNRIEILSRLYFRYFFKMVRYFSFSCSLYYNSLVFELFVPVRCSGIGLSYSW